MEEINNRESWTLITKALGDHEITTEKTRLQNSIDHLERSNSELQEFVADEDGDELAGVIDENNAVIANQKMRIEVLDEEIKKRGLGKHAKEEVPSAKVEETKENDVVGASGVTEEESGAADTSAKSNPPSQEDQETVIHL